MQRFEPFGRGIKGRDRHIGCRRRSLYQFRADCRGLLLIERCCQSLEPRVQVGKLMHPFIEGELACGNLRNRGEILALLSDLPRAIIASEEEVLFFIERHGLMGQGIGYIDAHLLAATSLEDSARLWTRDKRLLGIAQDLGLKHEHD